MHSTMIVGMDLLWTGSIDYFLKN